MKKIEELKKKLEMMILKRKKLSPDDTETIQKHPNATGDFDYYIKSETLTSKASFRQVGAIIEDYKILILYIMGIQVVRTVLSRY